MSYSRVLALHGEFLEIQKLFLDHLGIEIYSSYATLSRCDFSDLMEFPKQYHFYLPLWLIAPWVVLTHIPRWLFHFFAQLSGDYNEIIVNSMRVAHPVTVRHDFPRIPFRVFANESEIG